MKEKKNEIQRLKNVVALGCEGRFSRVNGGPSNWATVTYARVVQHLRVSGALAGHIYSHLSTVYLRGPTEISFFLMYVSPFTSHVEFLIGVFVSPK